MNEAERYSRQFGEEDDRTVEMQTGDFRGVIFDLVARLHACRAAVCSTEVALSGLLAILECEQRDANKTYRDDTVLTITTAGSLRRLARLLFEQSYVSAHEMGTIQSMLAEIGIETEYGDPPR
jgi:hypothetical protein